MSQRASRSEAYLPQRDELHGPSSLPHLFNRSSCVPSSLRVFLFCQILSNLDFLPREVSQHRAFVVRQSPVAKKRVPPFAGGLSAEGKRS